jgi:cytochrome c553
MPYRFAPLASFAMLLAAGLLSGCHTTETIGPQASILGNEHVCASCHGLEGHSDNPSFPNLAAQQEEYLVNQLKAFRGKTRADPHAHTYMWGMAAKLDDATIEGLAKFFASQRAAPPSHQDPILVAAGEKIYRNGVEWENVPACVLCHGETGEGGGAIPRLADQHRVYIEGQLRAFKVNSRNNETMHANAVGLTPDQISAVAAYVASR